jgi:hypothetical protein
MSVKTSMGCPIGAGIFLALAHAMGAATVVPFVDPVSVFEGSSGNVLFTVQNTMDLNITITSVQASGFERTGADMEDMVTSSSIGADNCTGSMLQPGGVCFFALGFQTADNSGNNDISEDAMWRLSAKVFADFGTPPDSEVSTGSVTVNVLDAVPEPASATLFCAGVLVLLGYQMLCRRMRRRNIGRIR